LILAINVENWYNVVCLFVKKYIIENALQCRKFTHKNTKDGVVDFMKPINIISACNSIQTLNDMEIDIDVKKINKNFNLSVEEAQSLSKLINELKIKEATTTSFNGFYVSYSIPQISKEFDLLRFSDDLVINIELKGPLDYDIKAKKITEQMIQNYYYLKFLSKKILIFTYVEDDGLYQYNEIKFQSKKVEINNLLKNLENQKVNYNINLDNIFIPSNYLISPFNNTLVFLNRPSTKY
jgi:hypothetical protein